MGRKGKPPVEPAHSSKLLRDKTDEYDLQAGGLGMSLQEAQAMIADDPQAGVLHDAEVPPEVLAEARKADAESPGGVTMVLTAEQLAAALDEPEPLATARTVECTGHVADEQGKQCRLCGKPLSLLSPGQRTVAMVRREAVPGPALDMTWSVQLSELWHSRLVMLAERDQMSPSEYAECLIRRQWVASGGAKR